MNHETLYQLTGGKAKLGIAPVGLTGTYRQAVLVWSDDIDLALVPSVTGTARVFRVSEFRTVEYLGDLEVNVPDVDDLYEEVEALLARCPRCGGTGEVAHGYSNEAGHWVRDWLPCPVCAPKQREDQLPF